jgi:hypothetical protein
MVDDSVFDIAGNNNPENKYARFFRDYEIDIKLIEDFAFAGSGGSVDLSSYYTKTQADALLAQKENTSDLSGTYYSKSQTDSFLSNKADSAALASYLLASTRGAAAGVASLDNGSLVPFTQLPAGSSSSQVSIGNHTHSTYAPKLTVRTSYITTGSVTPPNTSGAWQALSGFEIDIPAVENDFIEIAYNAMCQSATGTHYDMAVIKGSSLVRFLATGTATPAPEGDPGWYPNSITTFEPHAGPHGFTATSSDIDSGNIRLVVACKSNNTGLLYAESSYPFYWQVKNYGPVN